MLCKFKSAFSFPTVTLVVFAQCCYLVASKPQGSCDKGQCGYDDTLRRGRDAATTGDNLPFVDLGMEGIEILSISAINLEVTLIQN